MTVFPFKIHNRWPPEITLKIGMYIWTFYKDNIYYMKDFDFFDPFGSIGASYGVTASYGKAGPQRIF